MGMVLRVMLSFISRRKQDEAFHALAGNRVQAFAVGFIPFFLHGKRVLLDFQSFEPERTMAVGQDGFPSGTQVYPKSVIRLWGDCPLVSCSMLLA